MIRMLLGPPQKRADTESNPEIEALLEQQSAAQDAVHDADNDVLSAEGDIESAEEDLAAAQKALAEAQQEFERTTPLLDQAHERWAQISGQLDALGVEEQYYPECASDYGKRNFG